MSAVYPGKRIRFSFGTQSADGSRADADSLPTGVLVRNGADTAETVTVVSKAGTGSYYFDVTVPVSYVVGDDISVDITAVVGGKTSPPMRVFEAALEAQTPVVVGPVVGTAAPVNAVGKPVELEVFQLEAKTFNLTVNDSVGSPVDLSGKTLRFVVQTTANVPTALFKVDQADSPGIVVSGGSNEVAEVSVDGGDTNQTHGTYEWRLWDLTNNSLLMHGPFRLLAALQNTT